ncbi:hypothetical protein [Halomicrobium katesii]|uniref:hypothetical protein n=1 Tax=Halomicrobium katesii TaxID=437163 RepID=UPI00037E61C5|nr:hypothetical protein [Halomicrobium katesii]
MSTDHATEHQQTTDESTPDDELSPELAARLETLRAENERLRSSYARARQSQYRQTAIGFAAVGLVATIGGVVFPSTQTILLALGGTGVFAAVLTWFVTPERFVSASVGDAVYEALARNHERLCRELGLTDRRIYVPTADPATGVRLFVPQQTPFEIPDADDLSALFVVTDEAATRGVALRPTGETLFGEFESALSGSLADTPDEIATQVRAAIVEQFEIADAVELDLDRADGRLTVSVDDSVYGDLGRFDHPIVSIAAVALARGLERPIRAELAGEENVATLRWEPAQAGDDETAVDETRDSEIDDDGE